jgi:hypothetical protein
VGVPLPELRKEIAQRSDDFRRAIAGREMTSGQQHEWRPEECRQRARDAVDDQVAVIATPENACADRRTIADKIGHYDPLAALQHRGRDLIPQMTASREAVQEQNRRAGAEIFEAAVGSAEVAAAG